MVIANDPCKLNQPNGSAHTEFAQSNTEYTNGGGDDVAANNNDEPSTCNHRL
jgi:hypothetical protein